MLEALRNSVDSWTAKILLALLVLSFAVWGIADVFTNRAGTVVATVGEKEVTTLEFERALSNDIQTLQRQAGRVVSINEARQLGRVQVVIANLSTRKALNAEAESLGISAPPEAVRNVIAESPAFRGPGGTFDRFSYEALLDRQGLSPAEYEEGVRQDLAREAMLQAVGAGTAAPRELAETLHRFRNEQRILDYIALETADAADPGEPTDEQLTAFHEDNADRFSAPDYRAISYAWLTPDLMAATIEIDDDRVTQAYAQRIAEFTTPPTRTLDQLLFDTEEAANEAKARIDEGATFASIVEERGASRRDVSLGQVGRGELPGALDAAAFAASEPGVTGPVKTAFGWTLLDIRNLEQQKIQQLADVSDSIRRDLALSEAQSIINEESVAMDDEIAGGASLEQIADRTAANYGKIDAVDATGLGADGEPVADLPDISGFLTAAFAAIEGEEPTLVEADGGGYYALSVDGITPATLRPLDDVRDDVIAAWKEDQRSKALAELVKDIRGRLEQGTTLAVIAAETEKDITTSAPMRRSEQPGILSQAIVDKIFRAEMGGAIDGRATTGGFVIGTLREVVTPSTEEQENAIDSTAERYSTQLANDLVQTFSRSAIERHPLLLYPPVIDYSLANLGQRY